MDAPQGTGSPPTRRAGSGWVALLALAIIATAAAGWWVSPRAAGATLSGFLIALGLLRLVLRTATAGDIVVRSRVIDSVLCLGLGAMIGLISAVLPP